MRLIRDYVILVISLIFVWLYIPHIIAYSISRNRSHINYDIKNMLIKSGLNFNTFFGLLFFLHSNSYFRSLFYHRIGIISILISWYRPGNRYFIFSKTCKIDGGFVFAHPYCTIINAESIGKNFSCIHLTTIGSKGEYSDRPTIMDNVTLGAGVMIFGKITIGNNVLVGAGSVVNKDVPDNCVVVGNPARIISRNGIRTNESL